MKIAVVTGTGPPFSRLIEGVARYADAHPEVSAWAQHGGARLPRPLDGRPLVPRAELLERLHAADVVVCHGGTGAIADALDCGHVPIVVPRRAELREAVNDHQLEIATRLGTEGRVVVLEDVSRLGEAIAQSKALPGRAPSRGSRALPEAVAREVVSRAQKPRKRTRVWWWVLRVVTVAVRPRRVTQL